LLFAHKDLVHWELCEEDKYCFRFKTGGIHCATDSAQRERAMQNTAEPVYSASSPFILDSDMLGAPENDPDLEFFDSSHFEAATSPFLAEDFATDNSQFIGGFVSPNIAKSPLPTAASLLDTKVQSLSAPSTASPAGSYQDSSSDSSGFQRKSSSDSSRSALTNGDIMMANDVNTGDWKVEGLTDGNFASGYSGYDGTINPAAMEPNLGFNDESMENDFDFDSAASSPSFGNGPVDMESPDMPTIRYDTPRKNSAFLNNKYKSHNKMNSVSISGIFAK
jgi:hypothetical protein